MMDKFVINLLKLSKQTLANGRPKGELIVNLHVRIKT